MKGGEDSPFAKGMKTLQEASEKVKRVTEETTVDPAKKQETRKEDL